MKRLLAAGLFLLAVKAQAFELLNPDIKTTWGPGQVYYYCDLGTNNNLALTKLATWSQYMSGTSLAGLYSSQAPVWGNGRNDIAWSADENLNYIWPSNVLAICLPNFDWTTGQFIETDIVLNSAFNLNSQDLGRILLHEIGHSIGLGHSHEYAIMDPYIGSLDHLTADDIAGAQFLYPERSVPDTGGTVALLALSLAGLFLIEKTKQQTKGTVK